MDENIKDRWREYFDELFNREQGNVLEDIFIATMDENKELCLRNQKSRVL